MLLLRSARRELRLSKIPHEVDINHRVKDLSTADQLQFAIRNRDGSGITCSNGHRR